MAARALTVLAVCYGHVAGAAELAEPQAPEPQAQAQAWAQAAGSGVAGGGGRTEQKATRQRLVRSEAKSTMSLEATNAAEQAGDDLNATVSMSREDVESYQYPRRGGGSRVTGSEYPDVLDANGICGSQKYVKTCGFDGTRYMCVGKNCYTGLCVCTSAQGCREPLCQPPPAGFNCRGATCKDGTCLVYPGTGWQCWHPCNYGHQPSSFGEMGDAVNAIRAARVCEAPAGLQDMHLDAGLKLSAEAWPVFGGESEENGGGSHRRRSEQSRLGFGGGGAQQGGGPAARRALLDLKAVPTGAVKGMLKGGARRSAGPGGAGCFAGRLLLLGVLALVGTAVQ